MYVTRIDLYKETPTSHFFTSLFIFYFPFNYTDPSSFQENVVYIWYKMNYYFSTLVKYCLQKSLFDLDLGYTSYKKNT